MEQIFEEQNFSEDKLHEECGVFGIFSHNEDVALNTYWGLYALQHRGQESTGIVVTDGERMKIKKGADVRGAGTDVIKIRGVKYLHGITYSIIPDQIEAGTYMCAAAATRGCITVNNITPKHLESITAKLREMGVVITEYDEAIKIDATKNPLKRCNIKTMPHPGFPTDCQPQFAALLVSVPGTSIINENVWDNRYQYVSELVRMGAHISVEGRLAIIEGGSPLTAAPVKATDLRAGAAMIIAALEINGVTEISSIQYIERGYEDVIEKFRALGADIKKVYYAGDNEDELRA